MSKQDFRKTPICVLRVNIHCNGCKKKVKKLLQKLEGVEASTVDVELGRVIVTGYVDPTTLIKKLVKSGKHAELWGAQRGSSKHFSNQIKTMPPVFEASDSKFGKNKQPRKGAQQQQAHDHHHHLQQIQKSVKFNLNNDEDDEFGSNDCDDADDFNGVGFGGHHHQFNRVMPMKKNAGLGPNGMTMNGGSNGSKGGNAKKAGGDFDLAVQMIKGKDGNKYNSGSSKDGTGNQIQAGGAGKKNGGGSPTGPRGKNGKGETGNQIQAAGKKCAVNNKGGKEDDDAWGKNGRGRYSNGFHEIDMNGGGGGNLGQMGQMGRWYPMGNIPAVQGLPATAPPPMNGGGYFQGMGLGNNPCSQQYMAAMTMNHHQRQGGYGNNNMFQPMMHWRQPQPVTDNYTHIFSDENTSSCSIM